MSPAVSAKLNGLLNMFRVAPHSWVMLDENKNFVPLPKEKVLFTSPPRTTLTLQSPNSYPGKTPLHISSSGGVAFLTNQRVISTPLFPASLLPQTNTVRSSSTSPARRSRRCNPLWRPS